MAKCYEQRGSMADIKKIEIIERITDFNGAVIENTLTSWDHFYVKESVEDIRIRVPKGQKDIIKAAAESVGESLNTYVRNAIDQRMEQDCEK